MHNPEDYGNFGTSEVHALATNKDVEGLIGVLKHNKNKHVVKRAIFALGEIKDKKAVEPLIEVGLKSGLITIRSAVIRALGDIGSNEAVKPLTMLMNDEKEELNVREEITGVLGKIATEEAIHSLIAALDSELREKVSEVLKEVGEPAVMPLIGALSGDDEPIIWEVSTILGEIRDKRAVKPLITLLLDGSKDDYKRGDYVAVALGRIGDAGAVKPFIQLVSKHNEDLLTCMSVRALGDISDDKAVEPLIAILEDEGTTDCSHLRMETCWALGKIRDVRAIGSLIRILGDPRNNLAAVRDAAASALVQLDDDRIELPLLKYFKGELDSIVNSETSVQNVHQGTLEGVVKLITRLIAKS